MAGDSVPTRLIANWIIGRDGHEEDNIQLFYYSTKHKTNIDLKKMMQFLALNNTPEFQRSMEYFSQHKSAVYEIADGKKLWDNENTLSESMKSFQKYVKSE